MECLMIANVTQLTTHYLNFNIFETHVFLDRKLSDGCGNVTEGLRSKLPTVVWFCYLHDRRRRRLGDGSSFAPFCFARRVTSRPSFFCFFVACTVKINISVANWKFI